MFIRAVFAWLTILILAILNGTFRQGILIPRVGEPAGPVLSTMLLVAFVLVAAWFFAPWMRLATRGDAWRAGILWLVLTLAFEFLGGHYLFGAPWEQLLADYDLTQARIWILVPITTLVAPVVVQAVRAHGK
jgi:hypothetical protein